MNEPLIYNAPRNAHVLYSGTMYTRTKPRTPNVYGWELVYGAVSIPCHDAFCFTSLYNTPVMTVVESSIC